jgi:hypothetical protein
LPHGLRCLELWIQQTTQERDSQTEYSRLEIDLSSTGEWRRRLRDLPRLRLIA